MSRRTFIKQWNPNVPIGERGRGRRRKGSDPDQPFGGAFRTIHDPSRDRSAGGRDAEAPTRFYSASGLNAAGLPQQNDRFRAFTMGGTRGGRGGNKPGIQQRSGMFRNAVQSSVIFGIGAPSDKVIRHSQRKIDRLVAPESDVTQSVREWRQSPPIRMATQRRRGAVYEYESDEEEEEEEEEDRGRPRRRVSNARRAPDQRDTRRDPDYDPYEFREDDDMGEAAYAYQPARPSGRHLSNSRLTMGGPSTARPAPPVYANERLRDERIRPRRLFDGDMEEEEEERRRRLDRRGDERHEPDRMERRYSKERGRRLERRGEERHEPDRMERRNSKRPRELSPADLAPPPAAARHPVARRYSQKRREPEAAPAAAPQTSAIRFKDKEKAGGGKKEKARSDESYYTPSIAQSIARRILSGLPPIRLKNDSGSESYLSASRSIIAGALDRFTTVSRQDETEGDPPGADAQSPPVIDNPGQTMMRALFDRTQRIDVSEASGEESVEEEEKREGRGAFENIFSRHTREASPVLERLFNQTIRDRGMSGLATTVEEEFAIAPRTEGGSSSGSGMSDPFAMPPRVAGDSSASDSASRSSSASSLFSERSHRHVSMAASHHTTLALMEPHRGPPRESQRTMTAAGSGASSDRSSSSHSSDRSIGGMGRERSFHFQMSQSTHSAAPRNPNPYGYNTNDGSFNFEF